MASESPNKRQRVGADGEYSMSLTLSGNVTFAGQSVGELLLDLKSRVLQLEERAKNAEERADRAEAELAKKAGSEAMEASFATLSENKSDKTTCNADTHNLENVKADKADVAERVAGMAAELEVLKVTMASHAKVMEAELGKQKAVELERQKAEEADKQRIAELERQRAAEIEAQRVAELERQRVALAADEAARALAEHERQQAADREKQQAEDLQKQQAAAAASELEKQNAAAAASAVAAAAAASTAAAAVAAAAAAAAAPPLAAPAAAAPSPVLQRKDSTVDVALAAKSGTEFLAAQVANLSEGAKKAHKEIEVALKEEIDFTPSSSNLTAKGKKIVNKVAEVLKKHPAMVIRIEGHTGCRCIAGGGQPKRGGPKCKAVELSDDRAASVIEHLKASGCSNTLKSKGHGCIFRVGMAVKVFPAAGQ